MGIDASRAWALRRRRPRCMARAMAMMSRFIASAHMSAARRRYPDEDEKPTLFHPSLSVRSGSGVYLSEPDQEFISRKVPVPWTRAPPAPEKHEVLRAPGGVLHSCAVPSPPSLLEADDEPASRFTEPGQRGRAMGALAMERLIMAMRRVRRRRQQIQARDGSAPMSAKRGCSSRQQDEDSQGGKRMKYSGPDLPEDIWCHIRSLLSMQDAARAACVSRSFLHSWRCRPNLTFTNETMCPKEDLKAPAFKSNTTIRDYNDNIVRVLRNRPGDAAVTKLKLDYHVPPLVGRPYRRLDRWLQIAVTPRTEELELLVWSKEARFNFPCTLLSDSRCGGSIQKLLLFRCALRSTFQLGLRSLKTLHLRDVRVTGEDLGRLLSGSTALEHLKLVYCDDIVRLETPCLLQRLSFLEVAGCMKLQVIENKAPNLSRFYLEAAGEPVQVSFGESKVKKVHLMQSCAISYALDNLPSRAPNLETLTLCSICERVNAPMAASSKFLHLKFLSILLINQWNFHQDYDYLSLIPFFDASPFLETFRLYVCEQSMWMYDWFEGDPSSLRRMPQHCHGNLKNVKIIGFFPQKSMVELTRHLLENTTSLESLTVDTSPATYRCSVSKPGRKCCPLEVSAIVKAHRSVLAVKKYIEGNVPSTVKSNVPEPCGRGHRLKESGVKPFYLMFND